MKRAVLGVGNPLRRDDGVGPWVAQHLEATGWTAYVAGATPENILGKIQRDAPRCLVVVDAAELRLPPGTFRRLPTSAAPSMVASTHGLPLSFILSLLDDAVEQLVLVGIQSKAIESGEGLSPEVEAGARRLVSLLVSGNLDDIPLHPPRGDDIDRAAAQGED